MIASVQQADSRARKKAIWILSIGSALGFSALLLYSIFEQQIYATLEHNIQYYLLNPQIPAFVVLAIMAPVLFAAVYLFTYGHRVIASKRIPPPNYAVVRDTVIHTGAQAIFRGYVVKLLATLLFLISASIPIYVWFLFSSFSADA